MIGTLSIAAAQVNPIVGNIAYNLELVRNALERCKDTDLVVFPELVICGYPPEDLVLKPSFIEDCVTATKEFIAAHTSGPAFILTTPWIENGKSYNAALFVENGAIKSVTLKKNLPNYGVFDEWRVFSPSDRLPEPVEFKGHKLGIVICEDIWFPEACRHLKERGAEMILSPNGSPYSTAKAQMRHDIIDARVRETGLPLLYVNQIGGQDDLVYDGNSMAYNARGEKIFQAPHCESYIGPVSGLAAKQDDLEQIYAVMKRSLKDYITKNNFPGVIIGMSGGIDSALSAAVAADALGADKVRCVMMPSPFTSKDSFEDAEACCHALGCSYEIISIEPAMKAYAEMLPSLSGLAHENMQSRARGLVLMSLSNQTGAMVLTTGNKSEMAVGYATLYGDMCGGYNVLKDVYKTLVYKLSVWRNSVSPVIPERIITKAPTAELRENQTDQDSLPPYDILDGILEGLIERNRSVRDLAAEGYDKATVLKVNRLLDIAEYKRRQSAPGPKITPMAFGRDRRYPITNGYRFFVEKS
ncbi:MAG: NAD+ synthase [Micavibrio aeruginosavorus]|uniref:Glutamine-dependent NAD(+) synthetase n=1 Tax=Micavibrio aeruginosavorus TaxID=349221 RepID=A0A2W5BW14_9BACT|nr:MAG: NAD+ synthase [Micavibrio aeruginosavorus]